MKVYAVVAWFNPNPKYVKNLLTYCEFVDGVIVVDDSTTDSAYLFANMPKIEYICTSENKGIASALNTGYQLAIKMGAEWVLTMDQDSSFESDHIRKLLNHVGRQTAKERIAVFAPNLQGGKTNPRAEDCNSVITSGSLVSLNAYQKVSGYNEELFIDQVDHEFCFRLKKSGFRIIRLNDVFMNHIVGAPLSTTFLGVHMNTSNHSHTRRYYMTRNRLYMRRNYPEFGAPYLKMIAMDLLKVALLEKEKFLKLRYMVKGAMDYFKGVNGKLL